MKWEMQKTVGADEYLVWDNSDGYLIATLINKDEALLIAAAPELLKACQIALNMSDHPNWVYELLQNVIAKAEGKRKPATTDTQKHWRINR